MTIPTEAIEAAARALFAVENCDRRQMLDVESNWHGRLNDENRQEYRVLATAALTSAAPAIQAAALRDAAEAAAVEQPFLVVTWLRARADQLEKGKSE